MIRGKVWKFGDDVNTEVIMPGKYLAMRDPAQVASHVMEGLDPEFGQKAKPGDLIVAGKNFGCGSSRETAPGGLKAFGIGAIIAASFARIFLRNSVNIGLPILECPAAAQGIKEGHVVAVDIAAGRIIDETTGGTYQAAPFPPFLQELIAAGGLVPYTRKRLGLT
ncbi:MAG: 3-isopropylmalate dehydratase small subunit [Anaerolineae bacterium]